MSLTVALFFFSNLQTNTSHTSTLCTALGCRECITQSEMQSAFFAGFSSFCQPNVDRLFLPVLWLNTKKCRETEHPTAKQPLNPHTTCQSCPVAVKKQTLGKPYTTGQSLIAFPEIPLHFSHHWHWLVKLNSNRLSVFRLWTAYTYCN